jgi:hypothetical protein
MRVKTSFAAALSSCRISWFQATDHSIRHSRRQGWPRKLIKQRLGATLAGAQKMGCAPKKMSGFHRPWFQSRAREGADRSAVRSLTLAALCVPPLIGQDKSAIQIRPSSPAVQAWKSEPHSHRASHARGPNRAANQARIPQTCQQRALIAAQYPVSKHVSFE